MIWNPFKKKAKTSSSEADEEKKEPETSSAPAPKMGMLGRLAMKKLEKMSPQERSKMMQEATNPKNRGKLLAAMEMMKKTGQISESQYNEAKRRLGL